MLSNLFNSYIKDIEGLKLTAEVLNEGVPQRINKDKEKYKVAFGIDEYLSLKLSGKSNNALEEAMKEIVTIIDVDVDKKSVAYKINKDKIKVENQIIDVEEAQKAKAMYINTLIHLQDNILISLLIKFENILSIIFREIIKKYPEVYLTDKEIKYSKIMDIDNMGDLKKYIISKELNDIMRRSIFDWFDLLNTKHRIKIKVDNSIIKKFIKAYYVRNLLVHNNGKINDEYKANMKKIDLPIEEKNIFICLPEYIDEAIESSIYTLFSIMYSSLKIFDNEQEDFVNEILEYGINLIGEKKYDLARGIFEELKDDKKITNELQIYCKMNYWQTFKWCNEFDVVKKEVEGFDFSACNDYIKLGMYALLDKFEELFSLIDTKLKNNDDVKALVSALEEWPIFQKIREEAMYKAIRKKHINFFECKSSSPNIKDDESTEFDNIIN